MGTTEERATMRRRQHEPANTGARASRQTSVRAAILFALFLSALILGAGSGRLAAEPASENTIVENTIVVSGTGAVSVVPDRAEIEVAVVSTAASAEAAIAANSAAVRKVLDRLAALGVGDGQTGTSRFDLAPQYARSRASSPTRAEAPRIVGYRVTNQLLVRDLPVGDVGRLLDALVGAGANRVLGLRFTVSDPKIPGEAAMREAVADARRRAAIYAAAAGVALGPVLRIRELGGFQPQPRLRALAEASSVPVRPGVQSITASVSVTFALGASAEE